MVAGYTNSMGWDKKLIANHLKAAKKLDLIMSSVFKYIKNNPKTDEYQVQQLILKEFKKHGVKMDNFTPIVAFRENTSHVHYHPSQYCKKLKPNSLILIDIWGRLNQPQSPYADITWMAYYGKKVPKELSQAFELVIRARDESINFVKQALKKQKLPTGHDIDAVGRNIIDHPGKTRRFLHGTGHELGFASPHGLGRSISPRNKYSIKRSMGYTIEPGLYVKNKFGMRSEMNFYILGNKFIPTTKIQKKLILL